MPQRMQSIFMSICCRCGHAWRSRRGKPLRCAKCKSPYWDRAVKGQRTRGIVPPPNTQAAARSEGARCTAEQARDILATWQANRSYVALSIETNLGLVNCCGLMCSAGPSGVEISDAERSVVHISIRLDGKASYQYRVGEAEHGDQPYETLAIRVGDCLTSLGAFREKPKSFRAML